MPGCLRNYQVSHGSAAVMSSGQGNWYDLAQGRETENTEAEEGCISIVLRNPPHSELHLQSLPGPLQINTGRWHKPADFPGSTRTVKVRTGQ